MTHRSRLWKSPPLVEQFELYRENNGSYSLEDYPDLLEEAGPQHIHDLVVEARELLRRKRCLTYVFSGATIGHVAQYDVSPGYSKRLDGASLAYNPAENTHVFTRLYDMRVSLKDTLKVYELKELALEYGDDLTADELAVQEAIIEEGRSDFSRRVDTLFYDAYLPHHSGSTDINADGSPGNSSEEMFLVTDYMALGYLLEYSGLVERP